ncbi:MAG: hypothetical protein RLZZ30_158 [Bacteroidota bacterium]
MHKPFALECIPSFDISVILNEMKHMKFTSILFILFLFPSVFAQKRAIQLNLEKGRTYYHNMRAESEIFQRTKGKTSKFEMLMETSIRYKVKSVKKDSYYIEAQYQNMRLYVNSGDGTVVDIRSEKSSENIMSQIFYQFCQTPFHMEISKYGEIRRVEIGNLLESAVDDLPVSSDKKEKLKKELELSYGEKSFKGNFEIITLIYPNTLVDMNETWQTKTRILSRQMDAELLNTYQWTGNAKNGLMVEGKASILSDQQMENDQLKKVDGSSSISMILDEKSGWIRSATVHQSMRLGNKDEDGYLYTKIKTTYSDH